MNPDLTDAAVEAAARALAEEEIRRFRKWDTEAERLEKMMPDALDYCWQDYESHARAALLAALQSREEHSDINEERAKRGFPPQKMEKNNANK